MPWPDEPQVSSLLASAGIDPGSDADVLGALSASIAYLTRLLRMNFTPSTGAKRFDGTGNEWLPLPAFSAVTLVERVDNDGVVQETLDDATYLAYPANDSPKLSLRRVASPSLTADFSSYYSAYEYPMDVVLFDGSLRGVWPAGAQNIRVTATWADSDGPPEDVAAAAAKLAALRLMGAYAVGLTGGALEYNEQNKTMERFSEDPLRQLRSAWKAEIDDVIALRRRKFLVVP